MAASSNCNIDRPWNEPALRYAARSIEFQIALSDTAEWGDGGKGVKTEIVY